MYNLDLIGKFVSDYNAQPVDTEISPSDQMNNQWYFEVGRSAVEVILAGVMSSYLHRVTRVLDLPCGHGRVLRHLVRMFPEAEIHACDLDTDGVAFCAQRINSSGSGRCSPLSLRGKAGVGWRICRSFWLRTASLWRRRTAAGASTSIGACRTLAQTDGRK